MITFDGLEIPVHRLHQESMSSIGQEFVGGLTLLFNGGGEPRTERFETLYPTKDVHTEPAYYEQVKKYFTGKGANLLGRLRVVVLEINQTNTPCSRATCRPKLLGFVKHEKLEDLGLAIRRPPLLLVRLSAYQVYESSPPHFHLVTEQYQALHLHNAPVNIGEQSGIIHRSPDCYRPKSSSYSSSSAAAASSSSAAAAQERKPK